MSPRYEGGYQAMGGMHSIEQRVVKVHSGKGNDIQRQIRGMIIRRYNHREHSSSHWIASTRAVCDRSAKQFRRPFKHALRFGISRLNFVKKKLLN